MSNNMEIIESPFIPIIADIVKNNKNLTPELQNAIAKFISYESTPIFKTTAPVLFTEAQDD